MWGKDAKRLRQPKVPLRNSSNSGARQSMGMPLSVVRKTPLSGGHTHPHPQKMKTRNRKMRQPSSEVQRGERDV